MPRERCKNPEFEPKYVVYCKTCDFRHDLDSTTMVDKVAATDIAQRHSTLYPQHEVYVVVSKLKI